ncbi:hypothetical protein C8Q74DRAFT_456428 [Fomes fomentarius]|nr:hypothetical protein C8Q74DRAFT_456428 [Fomes fomentarius]
MRQKCLFNTSHCLALSSWTLAGMTATARMMSTNSYVDTRCLAVSPSLSLYSKFSKRPPSFDTPSAVCSISLPYMQMIRYCVISPRQTHMGLRRSLRPACGPLRDVNFMNHPLWCPEHGTREWLLYSHPMTVIHSYDALCAQNGCYCSKLWWTVRAVFSISPLPAACRIRAYRYRAYAVPETHMRESSASKQAVPEITRIGQRTGCLQ